MVILEEKRLQMSMASIFHKDTDLAIVSRFERAIKTLHENERAQQILMLFKADRLQRYLSYEYGDIQKNR